MASSSTAGGSIGLTASRRGQVVLAGLCGVGAAAVIQSGVPGLGDTDPYRHLEYAHQLVASGFRLRGHPFLPLTLLGDSGVDLWWGFHLLLIPFTPLGVIWGARAAGCVIGGVTTAFLAWFIHRAGQTRAVPFALLPLAMSAQFAARDALARPAHLTVALVLISLLAGAGEIGWGWAFAAGAVHLALHLSAPLSPGFAALGWGVAFASGRRQRPVAVGASVLGELAMLAVRPDRAHFVQVATLHNLGAMGLLSHGLLPHAGGELHPIPLSALLGETWLGWATLLVGVALARMKGPASTGVIRRAVGASVVVGLLMTLRAARFVDYLAPFLAVAAALSWPEAAVLSLRGKVAAGVLALGGCYGFSRGVQYAWAAGREMVPAPQTVSAFADQVRSHVPPGTLLFIDDFFLTGVLYSALPDYRYIGAYEPAILYVPHPDLFWSWHHAVVEGIDCDQPTCSPQAPSGAAIARAVDRFGTEWVITSYPPGVFSMQSVLLAGTSEFTLAAYVPGESAGLFLWHRNASRRRSAGALHK